MSDESTKQAVESNCNCVSYQKAASVEFDEVDSAMGFEAKIKSMPEYNPPVDFRFLHSWWREGARWQHSKDAAVIAGLKYERELATADRLTRIMEIDAKDKEITALKEEAEVHKKNAFYEMSKLAPLREEIELLKAEVDEMRKTGVREVNRVRHELEESNKTWSESLQAKSDECARLREENDELKAEIERRDIDEVCG